MSVADQNRFARCFWIVAKAWGFEFFVVPPGHSGSVVGKADMHNSGMFAAWLSAIFCYWRKGWDTFRQHWAGLFGVEGKSVGVWVSDEERWKACSWVLRRGRWGSCSLYSKPCDLHFWKVQMWRVSALPVFHELRQWLLWDKPRSQGQLDHLVLQPLHQECTRLRSQIWEALVFKAELRSFHFPKFLLHHSSFFWRSLQPFLILAVLQNRV